MDKDCTDAFLQLTAQEEKHLQIVQNMYLFAQKFNQSQGQWDTNGKCYLVE